MLKKIGLSALSLAYAAFCIVMLIISTMGYGYHGFADKTSYQMFLNIIEALLLISGLVAIIIFNFKIWRNKILGNKWFFILGIPLLVICYWFLGSPFS
jgi:uncharacterized membrane protein SirB2